MLEFALATATSSLPSPAKSPSTTASGSVSDRHGLERGRRRGHHGRQRERPGAAVIADPEPVRAGRDVDVDRIDGFRGRHCVALHDGPAQGVEQRQRRGRAHRLGRRHQVLACGHDDLIVRRPPLARGDRDRFDREHGRRVDAGEIRAADRHALDCDIRARGQRIEVPGRLARDGDQGHAGIARLRGPVDHHRRGDRRQGRG